MINKSHRVASDGLATLEWRGITLRHRRTEKIIIQDLDGCFESGDFLTIMGPSGAGKTSLLSVISHRLKALKDF